MPRSPKFFWIKRRDNPQFKKAYYVAYGRISQRQAAEMEVTIYGSNIMISFATEAEYNAAIVELRARGFSIAHEEGITK